MPSAPSSSSRLHSPLSAAPPSPQRATIPRIPTPTKASSTGCGGIDSTKDFRIGVTYALWGKRDEAEQIIKAMQTDKGNAMDIAYIYAALGDNDKTFEWLEKAYHNRDSYLALLKVELEFKKIRSDPRFKAMLKKIGLPE
jgi:aryl-alcohol dehydrogenase-like predicted oxidoreductase